MKVLGVDVGKRRVGLAISDEEGKFAFPLEVMEVEGEGEEAVVEMIKEVREREGAEVVVVGIPYSLKGTITPSTEFAQLIVKRLRERGLRVEEIDERLTTREAEKMMRREGGKKGKADKVAAALLLQVYLEKLGKK